VSHAGATLVLVLLMFGLAAYFVFVPPEGFGDDLIHRFTVPFILVACALTILENLKTRSHIAQLVGALRGLMGRAGMPPTPEAKREAIEILLKSLRSDKETVRKTAAEQLRRLTGETLGDTAEEWEQWWAGQRKNGG